jgi:hypothetical protein
MMQVWLEARPCRKGDTVASLALQVQLVGTFGTQLGNKCAQPREIMTHDQTWLAWKQNKIWQRDSPCPG